MDARDGFLHKLTPEQVKLMERGGMMHMIPLTEKQHEELRPLGGEQRKNNMRNKPCICGSNRKFKRCCWYKYG